MKSICAALVAACFAVPAHSDLMIKSDDGSQELRLYESACSHGGTLALIPEEYRKHFHNAKVLDRKGTILAFACWAEVEDTVLILFEDGQRAEMQLSKFRESTI